MSDPTLKELETAQPTPIELDGYDLESASSKEAGINQLTDISWFERNKKKVAVGAYLGALALTLNELGPIKDQLADSAHWTVPAIALSETVATTGLAAMAVSTGEKIRNPLTLRKRLNELKLKDKLHSSSLFRKGAYLNLAGAIGTSSVITVEIVSSFPVNAWPATLGIAGLSTALSLPFYKIARGNKSEVEDAQ